MVHFKDTPSAQRLQDTLEGFDTVDDVWQPLFAEGEALLTSEARHDLTYYCIAHHP